MLNNCEIDCLQWLDVFGDCDRSQSAAPLKCLIAYRFDRAGNRYRSQIEADLKHSFADGFDWIEDDSWPHGVPNGASGFYHMPPISEFYTL